MIKIESFIDHSTGHIYSIVHRDGIYRCPTKRITYTLEEAMKASNLSINKWSKI